MMPMPEYRMITKRESTKTVDMWRYDGYNAVLVGLRLRCTERSCGWLMPSCPMLAGAIRCIRSGSCQAQMKFCRQHCRDWPRLPACFTS